MKEQKFKAGRKHFSSQLYVFFIVFASVGFFVFLVSAQYGTGEISLIELNTPFNGTIELEGNVTFSYNITNASIQMSNCTLIFDGEENQTNTNINNSVEQYFYLYDISEGFYNWSVDCTESNNSIYNSQTRDFRVFIDTTSPVVNLDTPVDSSTFPDGEVSLNFSVTDNGWVTNCSLFTDINGTWEIQQTNFFVQHNSTLSFEVSEIPDDTTFEWNVLCYDFASIPNFAWASSNRTVIIDNNAPTYSTIPDQIWDEDNYTYINLSSYFSDVDGHKLNYASTNPSNIDVSIDNETGLVLLESDPNWYGSDTIIFSAFDYMGGNISSGSIDLDVVQQGDTPPNRIMVTPLDNYEDEYGQTTIHCNATDDITLNNISLYTDLGGNWHENQTAQVSGTVNSSIFKLYTFSEETSYNWACKYVDSSSQETWSENRTVDVSIKPILMHDIENYTVNQVDYNATIFIGYGDHLDGLLSVDNLTVYLSNGSVYLTKDFLGETPHNLNSADPPQIAYLEKIRVLHSSIFDGNYSIGNEELINISLSYFYLNSSRQISSNHNIKILEAI